ncbi:MAG: hypothetical protein ACRBG0_07460 [Lewinella sp.]|jgi:hypothetical protein|uniref:hypothetical protein n=1 Tax=Lewinella sp. TaxID=2004506 RepID=UPI003D6ABFA6
MGQILFANFLEDKRVYQLARLFWLRHVKNIAEEKGLAFHAYLNTESEFDGNPLFNAYFPSINKAIRIIQVDPAEASADIDLKAWLDNIAIGKNDKNKTTELVIDTVLSEGSKFPGKQLITQWIEGTITSDQDIENLISNIG